MPIRGSSGPGRDVSDEGLGGVARRDGIYTPAKKIYGGSRPGIWTGLILSGAFDPDLKTGIQRR